MTTIPQLIEEVRACKGQLPDEVLEGLLREAMAAGWNACRKSIYAVCEDVTDEYEKHREDTENAPRHHFGRGGMSVAKSIARGFNAMEAIDDDNLTAALSALIKEKQA